VTRRSNFLFGAPFRTVNIDCVQYDSCNGVMSASQQLRRNTSNKLYLLQRSTPMCFSSQVYLLLP